MMPASSARPVYAEKRIDVAIGIGVPADVRAREAERRERGDLGDLEGGRIVACGGGRELRYRIEGGDGV